MSMSYQTALTINEVIKKIHEKKYLLPSIQREFVWRPAQIERLFDSLMQDYPINAFLFWVVPSEKVTHFKFYEFLRNYHQKDNRHNPQASINKNEEIFAILDGQQRLTSLYIGLKGSYAEKLAHKRWNNENAYPEKKLYLNLLSTSKDADMMYDFKFLTKEEAENSDENTHWFLVSEIMNMPEAKDPTAYLIKKKLFKLEDEEKSEFALNTLTQLYQIIHKNLTISYYLEKSSELDKVLNIFIRINSGGTVLNYSDLLFSFVIAQWENRDAREEINRFVDEINTIGLGFNINKDMILKSSLVLCDFPDISFKVDNFNKDTMKTIEKRWDDLTSSIRLAVELIASFGFNRDNITSNYLFIPIAYYIQMKGNPNNFITSQKYSNDRELIKKWFITSLIKRIFSFVPDGVLKPIREIIKKDNQNFPYNKIVKKFKNTNRDISISDEYIWEDLLELQYGTGNTFLVLSLLYPWIDFKNKFHIDHIFPKSLFTVKKLQKRNYDEGTIDFYLEKVNNIANLQILDETFNKEKSDTEFDKWIKHVYSATIKRKNYKEKHYIPDVDLSFDNFEKFIEERKNLLFEALKKELQ